MGGRINDTEILREFCLPEDYWIVAPIIIGYPKKIPSIPERKTPHIVKVVAG